MTDRIRYEVFDGTAVLTLDRPSARNALDASMRIGLRRALRTAGDDPAVRSVVLTGTDPAFCAGVDLKELESGLPRADAGPDGVTTLPVPELTKPLIGAINGPAIAGGLELALHCHVLVASEQASFADAHGPVGVIPGWGLTALLARAVGTRRAVEMSLTARAIGAAEALRAGLVQHVVAHEDLLPHALDLARAMSRTGPDITRVLLGLYASSADLPLADAMAREREASAAWRRARSASVQPGGADCR